MQQNNSRTLRLPAGMKVQPLYIKCPSCGCDLQEFYQSESNQTDADHVNQDANEPGFSKMSADLPIGPIEIVKHEGFLVGMVNPLSNSPKEKTGRDESRWFRRVGREQAGPINEKDECTSCDKDFVPRIEGKFRQRIFHFLFRLLGGRYE